MSAKKRSKSIAVPSLTPILTSGCKYSYTIISYLQEIENKFPNLLF